MSDDIFILSEEAAENATKIAISVLQNIDQRLEENINPVERDKLISDKSFYTKLSDDLMDLMALYKSLHAFEKTLSNDPDNFDIKMDISEVNENIETLNFTIVSEYKKRNKLS